MMAILLLAWQPVGADGVPGSIATLGLPALPKLSTPTPQASAQVALGQKLFFDQRLSGDGSISCASCHQPERAFTDGRAVAQGIRKSQGTRNTPTVLNAAFNTTQFWDGRRDSLETQAGDPFLNPIEHGVRDASALVALVRADPDYVRAFGQAFAVGADGISTALMNRALASYERTLLAADSPFDRYLYGGDKQALSASARRGLALFRGVAQCASCHTITESDALLTDNRFHSLNIGLKRIESRLPALTTQLERARSSQAGVDKAVLSDPDVGELGRFAVTLDLADLAKFRTPSLRNVALTAPYMHDGSVRTLEEVVELEIYYRSAFDGRPLVLDVQEKRDLIEFLQALTSPVATRFPSPGP